MAPRSSNVVGSGPAGGRTDDAGIATKNSQTGAAPAYAAIMKKRLPDAAG
jgi:hypothetical protein